MPRRLIDSIPVSSRGVFVEAERLIRAHAQGLRIGEVSIDVQPRKNGVARGARPRLVLRALVDLARLFCELRLGIGSSAYTKK